jgi:hypothetical protein
MFITVFSQFVIASSIAVASVTSSQSKSNGQFTCSMNALTAEERANLPKVFDKLILAAPKVKELPDGYELTFSKSTGLFPLAAEWASAENRCCPFFDFSLSVVRNGGPMVVRITGPAGVKAFIADDLPRLHKLTSNR